VLGAANVETFWHDAEPVPHRSDAESNNSILLSKETEFQRTPFFVDKGDGEGQLVEDPELPVGEVGQGVSKGVLVVHVVRARSDRHGEAERHPPGLCSRRKHM
jgi:hypothetical protein